MTIRIGPLSIGETADIRPDLKERLAKAMVSRDQAREALGFYEAEVRALTQLITLEDQRFAEPEEIEVEAKELPDLSVFMLEKLRKNRTNKDTLRQAAVAAGYDVDGRSIHATLVNLVRAGKVQEDSTGFFYAG
jgi:hypothetical protein